MSTITKTTPSVSKPNLATIQRDIELALYSLKKYRYDQQLSADCFSRIIREFSDVMDESKLSSYYKCLSKAQNKIIALDSEIQKHEQYLIDFLIERI